MSSPCKMKTGFGLVSPENYLPETFFVIYLILAGILRRCGFKDCVMYSKHNKTDFTQELFDTGVLFNLYSEYGVGKSIEILIYELFATATLDPERNERNIFFREIIRLTPTIINIVRLKNLTLEAEWMMEYSMMMEGVSDDIANERIMRLSDLLYEAISEEIDDIDDQEKLENTDDDNQYDDEENQYDMLIDNSDDYSDDNDTGNDIEGINKTISTKLCYCPFCHAFRKYHTDFETRNVSQMINNTLIEITKEINNFR